MLFDQNRLRGQELCCAQQVPRIFSFLPAQGGNVIPASSANHKAVFSLLHIVQ